MSFIREDPAGGYVVGPVQPRMAEGEEPPGVTKARVTVALEDGEVGVGDGFLKSRDFEIAQANCYEKITRSSTFGAPLPPVVEDLCCLHR